MFYILRIEIYRFHNTLSIIYYIILKVDIVVFYEKLLWISHIPIVFRRVICQFKINCFGVGSAREKQFLQKIYSSNLTIAC